MQFDEWRDSVDDMDRVTLGLLLKALTSEYDAVVELATDTGRRLAYARNRVMDLEEPQ
jgi:hypothetical protein